MRGRPSDQAPHLESRPRDEDAPRWFHVNQRREEGVARFRVRRRRVPAAAGSRARWGGPGTWTRPAAAHRRRGSRPAEAATGRCCDRRERTSTAGGSEDGVVVAARLTGRAGWAQVPGTRSRRGAAPWVCHAAVRGPCAAGPSATRPVASVSRGTRRHAPPRCVSWQAIRARRAPPGTAAVLMLKEEPPGGCESRRIAPGRARSGPSGPRIVAGLHRGGRRPGEDGGVQRRGGGDAPVSRETGARRSASLRSRDGIEQACQLEGPDSAGMWQGGAGHGEPQVAALRDVGLGACAPRPVYSGVSRAEEGGGRGRACTR